MAKKTISVDNVLLILAKRLLSFLIDLLMSGIAGYFLYSIFFQRVEGFLSEINDKHWMVIFFFVHTSIWLLKYRVTFGQLIFKIGIMNINGTEVSITRLLFRNIIFILFLSRFVDDLFVIDLVAFHPLSLKKLGIH